MENEFKNIDPQYIDQPEIRAAVETLWTAGDLPLIASTIQWLLRQSDPLGRCAVFDVYSYRCTTYGTWLSEAFSGLLPSLITMARDTLHQVWGGNYPVRQPALRDRMVASGMHLVWRAVEMDDAPLVLRCLRSERHWRVLFPSVSAAFLMRGNDTAFDREVAPLLAEVAEREELPTLIRRLAIQALGESPSSEDLRLLAGLLERLSVPEAASCALILLDAGGDYERLVRDTAKRWPSCDEYPVPLVLERIAR
jgi:hypothetical protein